MQQHKDSAVETFGVVMALLGLTFLMAGTVSFAIAGKWLNSFSVMLTPVGAIMLAGSAIINWRLAVVLLLPAGVIGVAIGLIGYATLSEGIPTQPYLMPVFIGGVLMVISAVVNLPAIIRRPKRKGLIGANVAVMCIAGLALLAVANHMGTLWYARRDLTADRIYTLAPRTIQILSNLYEPVTATFIMPRSNVDETDQKVYDVTRNMLIEYARQSRAGNFRVQFIDPVNDPAEMLRFFAETGMGQEGPSVVFQSGHSFRQVMPHELIDQRAMQSHQRLLFTGEDRFTSALLHVIDGRTPAIYFTTGKGELPLDQSSEGTQRHAMSLLARAIRSDNYTHQTINLATANSIPEDCEILAIVGPKFPFRVREVDMIRDYLDRGGKLFVALTPEAAGAERSGLELLLSYWGIRPRSDLFAWAPQLVDNQGLFINARHPQHEVTSLLQTETYFPVQHTCALELVSPPAGEDGRPITLHYEAAPIAIGPEDSWGLRPPATKALEGPIVLAMASQQTGSEGARIVVIASEMLLSDAVIMRFQMNRNFVMNSINWLAQRTERLGILPKMVLDEPIRIDPREKDAIFYGTLFGLPYIVLLIGGIIYWRRSR